MSTIFMWIELAIDHLFLTVHIASHPISQYPCMHTMPFPSTVVAFESLS